MTHEEQRITIAKACGWISHQRPKMDDLGPIGNLTESCWAHPIRCRLEKGSYSEQCLPIHPPDYLNDLNEMHEAEKFLDSTGEYSERNYYASILGSLTYNDNGRGYKPLCNDDCYPIVHATASQRAEAFLKAKNLWKDD